MFGFLVSVALATTLTTTQKPALQTIPTCVFTRALPENNCVVYQTQPHDTLKNIALLYYGDESYWTNFWNDNPDIKDPQDLPGGLFLKVQTKKPEKPQELTKQLQDRLPKPQPAFQAAIVVAPQPVEAPSTGFEDVYKAAGAKYGVPWQILYGIHMTETGGRNGHIVSHLGNGPEGPMQFMPDTFASYAVDGDGDGVADIDNATDAIYTAANYLSKHSSLMAGLQSYGGNIPGTLAIARSRGFTL